MTFPAGAIGVVGAATGALALPAAGTGAVIALGAAITEQYLM